MTQPLRRSQFITTYGPGAILEGPEGPRIIPVLGEARLFDESSLDRRASSFEITDRRLSDGLLSGAGIVRLPSNAELGKTEQSSVYETRAFPTWSLCTRHGILYRKQRDTDRACPQCPALQTPAAASRQAQNQAIRFVRACPGGHMDDVDWRWIVNHATQGCAPSYLRWQGGGGMLRNVEVVCPICGGSVNLGLAYARDWPCSGRFPERHDLPGAACPERSKIIQRGAANLHITEIRTALTIPPRSTPLHRLLEMTMIRAVLLSAPVSGKQDLINRLGPLTLAGLIRAGVIAEIQAYPESVLMPAIQDTIGGTMPQTPLGLRLQEFEALQHAAEHGAPRVRSSSPGAADQFEVIVNDVQRFPGPGGTMLRVTPVNRLRVVMVQTGYRRLDPQNNPVDSYYVDNNGRRWYAGMELFGEGIFIDLAPDPNQPIPLHPPMHGAEANAWHEAWTDPPSYQLHHTDDERHMLHPVFVWWHTLAHRIITALGIDSGYSSASIRERVYLTIDDHGAGRGGVLLFTAQPGGDGTLGGLIALVPEFDKVLDLALRNVDVCSNDPLCGEERFASGRHNGAACYACSLISETSCEYRNTHLDRNLLVRNLP